MTAPLATSSGGALPRPAATYSFALNQGESASIAIESLNGKKVAFSLLRRQRQCAGHAATPEPPTTRPA